jgi:hypothetical protein
MRTAVTTRVGEGKRPVKIEHRIGLIENNVCWCGDCVGGSKVRSERSEGEVALPINAELPGLELSKHT